MTHKDSLLPQLSANSARLSDLRRVRLIASLSALVETAKLLPGIDAIVLAVEWAVLKTALPGALEVKDALRAGTRHPGKLMAAFAAGHWVALLHRAFGAAGGGAALALDMVTDAENLMLPAPFDGFDIPAPLADAAIAAMAHRAIRNLERDAAGIVVELGTGRTDVVPAAASEKEKQVA